MTVPAPVLPIEQGATLRVNKPGDQYDGRRVTLEYHNGRRALVHVHDQVYLMLPLEELMVVPSGGASPCR